LGPFTDQNEKKNEQFATGFTHGNVCTIEYYEPVTVIGQGEIKIDGIIHGYKSIRRLWSDAVKALGDSGNCNYDVGCSISAGWEDQIKSVAVLMTSNNSRFCTGALINNTGSVCKSYLLTANHCIGSNVGSVLNDIYMFNYESPAPQCPGTANQDGPTNQTVQGSTVIAKSAPSDFCLLELTNDPADSYDVYYSGWNRANSGMTETRAIHHPRGDVKKFSVDNDPPFSDSFTGTPGSHWRVADWDQGTTEPGSSGSPLYDQNKRIVGQLHGGGAACGNNSPDYYGKVWYSWDQAGSTNATQLAPWLDPINSGVTFLDGNTTGCSVSGPPMAAFNPDNSNTLTFCTSGTIDFTDISSGGPTSWLWSFSGAGVSPSSSTTQNTLVTVTTSGTLTVTLDVTNAEGTDKLVKIYNIVIEPCTNVTLCDNPNLAIPDDDPTGVSSTYTVGPSGTITDLDIEVDITHTYVGDLLISIEHNGTTVTIMDRPGFPTTNFGCNADDVAATFDDEGTSAVETTCGTPGIGGIVIPESALSVFDGMEQAGDWTITVSDNEGQDTGTLDEWCLVIASTQPSNCLTMFNNNNGLPTSETGEEHYESEDWISTTAPTVILSGARIVYDAADFIELNNGFTVEAGAIFEANIDGCPTVSPPTNNPAVEMIEEEKE